MSSDSSGPIAAPSPGLLDRSGLAAPDNSPFVYGLGFFDLISTGQALAGFHLFSHLDVSGLAVALAAFVNFVLATWEAVNHPLVGYPSDNSHSSRGRRLPWHMAGLMLALTPCLLRMGIPPRPRY